VQSLKDKFENLRLRLGQDRGLDSTGTEPIYYLVFPVFDILEVKRQTKAWAAKLSHDNWNVVTLSMADAVESVLKNSKLRKLSLQGEEKLLAKAEKTRTPVNFREINKSLSKALIEGGALQRVIDQQLQAAETQAHGLLLLTDLEALHPYLRINTIEAQLQGRVHCPVVVFYPGKREGKTSLRFLEFYPPDPNYRSEHIG
jgi:Domain of unknown function (DUF1788)